MVTERERILSEYSFFALMRDPDWRSLGVCWPDLDVPDDWLPLVEFVAIVGSELGAKCVQVKSKFGELRIYVRDPLTPPLARAIAVAQALAYAPKRRNAP